MTRKQALTDLLAKVEAGEHPTGSFLLHMRSAFPYHDKLAHAAHNGSLDAAKALHEAVLPGWDYEIVARGFRRTVNVYKDPCGADIYSGTSANPARAWLIAIIKALIAEETQ